jgi:FkbM family methyltransferase
MNRHAMMRIGYLSSHLLKRAFKISKSVSYSQCGEDLIVSFLLGLLKISKPTYLDIGAFHPKYLSNTYIFYKRGCSGVCVEPDPVLFNKFKKKRKHDTCLNIGVGAQSIGEVDFFMMSTPTLNTFSMEEAERYQSYGTQKIKKILPIEIVSINAILENHFDTVPDFISLDVEGFDLKIIDAIDYNRFKPAVFCIETLSYTEDRTEEKQVPIIDLMHQHGYLTYADTYINTIFVEKGAWLRSRIQQRQS